MSRVWCPFHPCIAVIVCAIFPQVLFLSLCLFPLHESTGAYDRRSPVRLVNWLQVLRLPALLQIAAKSPLPTAYHKTQCLSVCLSLSLSHLSSLLSNSDVYPADRVGTWGTWTTFRCICSGLQKQNGRGVMLSMPLIDELINVARRWVTAICSSDVPPSLWQVLMGTWPRSWADKRLLFPLENIITFFYQQAEGIHG